MYTNIDWILPMLSTSGGFATVAVAAPVNPQLIGTSVYVQGIRLHRSFNALGVITTNALRLQIVDGVDSRMWTSSWSSNQTFGTGIIEGGGPGGPVLLLDGR